MISVPINLDSLSCRICFEGNLSFSDSELIQPCKCTGSIGYVHERCLKKSIIYRSLQVQNSNNCEICLSEYTMVLRIDKSIKLWRDTPEDKTWMLVFYALFFILIGVLLMMWRIAGTVFLDDRIVEQDEAQITRVRRLRCLFAWLILVVTLLFGGLVGIFLNTFLKYQISWKILDKYRNSTFSNDDHIDSSTLIRAVKILYEQKEKEAELFT